MKEKVFSDWYHQTRDITARAGFDAAWQHQQAKVEELENRLKQAYEDIDTFAEAHERECGFKVQFAKEKAELQKRVDKALQIAKQGINKQGGDYYLEKLEQALKGGGE